MFYTSERLKLLVEVIVKPKIMHQHGALEWLWELYWFRRFCTVLYILCKPVLCLITDLNFSCCWHLYVTYILFPALFFLWFIKYILWINKFLDCLIHLQYNGTIKSVWWNKPSGFTVVLIQTLYFYSPFVLSSFPVTANL